MRRTGRAGAFLAAAALLLGANGCGGDDGEEAGPLSWARAPLVFAPQTLPRDRVLSGRLRNDSLERVDLRAQDLKLVDRHGRPVKGSITFLSGFVHGLYPPTREPSRLPDSELLRTGRIARILPGKAAPITASWRTRPGRARPTRIDYGRGSLPVPEGVHGIPPDG
jgi:hypothetical protein